MHNPFILTPIAVVAPAVSGPLTYNAIAFASPPDDDRLQQLRDKIQDTTDDDAPKSMRLIEWENEGDEEDEPEGTFPTENMPKAQIVNPYGCYGHTENPHRSNRNPNNANVHAHTICPNRQRMPTIGVGTQLQRWTCVRVVICSWRGHGPYRENPRTNRYSVEINSAGPCRNGFYRGASIHWIIDQNGRFYHGSTKNYNWIRNCND